MSRDDAAPGAATELVQRIRAGDAAAESELVALYGRGVTILVRRASSDPSAVDDLYQQTFQVALEKIRRGDLREPERLSGFICSLARNLVIEHFRKAAASRFRAPVDGSRAADPAPGPLESLLRLERASIVRRVLAELPSERDREILFRFYIAEDEKASICRDLGLTSLHFNRVLFRARERYRELYEETTRKTVGEPR
ncbi:MAG: sigma-70 family RNA polymerase sigma factor [Thermoanaerobaculia bacterium]|jgi:RNA polymerase sigma-70 factor (ECF subfamily)